MIGMDVVAILLECGPVQMQHDMLTPPEVSLLCSTNPWLDISKREHTYHLCLHVSVVASANVLSLKTLDARADIANY